MRATTIILNSAHHVEVIDYCGDMCSQAKLLKNATIFRCRQLLFAQRKGFTDLTEHEKFVLNEFKLTEDKYPPISNKYYLPTYEHFDYLFKITNNTDYNSCLGKHTAQKNDKSSS